MIIANSDYHAASEEENHQIEEMYSILHAYDHDALITGEGALTKDLITTADKDFQVVNVLSIAAIFVIILLTFVSFSLPFVLVLAIELAITVNMAVPYFTNTTLPFIAGIVIGTIQLGACVDYAILMTTMDQRGTGTSSGYQNGSTHCGKQKCAFDHYERMFVLCGMHRSGSDFTHGHDFQSV